MSTPGDAVREGTRPPRLWRRHPVLAVVGILLALAILLLADGAWAAFSASRDLRATRDHLDAAAADLAAANVSGAEAELAAASSEASAARSALAHPGVDVAGWFPILSRNVTAVRRLAADSASVATAGEQLTRSVRSSGWNGQGIPGWTSGQGVDLSVLERVQPSLATFSSALSRASASVDAIQTSGLLGPVRDAVISARSSMGSKAEEVGRLATLTGLLPDLLGGNGTQTYLLLAQNLSDPRGSGGYPGEFGLLTASDGHLSLGPLVGSDLLQQPVPPVSAPQDVKQRYGPFGGLTHLVASTYSPDFPTTARIILEMWSALGRPHADGVIAVDSVWMSYMLRGMSSVQVPGLATPITAQNANAMIGERPFLLPNGPSNRLETLIGATLFRAILSGSPSATTVASGMAQAARERHFQLFVTDPTQEAALSRLGVSGAMNMPRNPLAVFWDGASAGRTGYFATKHIDYSATLQTDGSAKIQENVSLHNGAPSGPPSILLGTGEKGFFPVGYYAVYANAYLPEGASGITSKMSTGPELQIVQSEFGHPVALQFLGVPSGASATWQLGYTFPSAVTTSDGLHRYDLQIVPQPALRPDSMTVKFVLPAGSKVTAVSPGLSVSGQTVTYSGTPVSPTDLWVEYK
jgi:hypothetical protein